MITKTNIAFTSVVLSGMGFVVVFALVVVALNSGGSENWAPLMAIVIGAWVVIAQAILTAVTWFCSKQSKVLHQKSLRWAAYLFFALTLLALLAEYISIVRGG
jgi:hypothetical protein